MPLTNAVIAKLNEITAMVEDKSRLSSVETDEIKAIFIELVKGGQTYNIDEIEYWFENEGSWSAKAPVVRIANISSYVQDKHQQTAHLRMVDDGCDC